jgi:putative tricarboxylic transport membrane protein
MNERIEKLLPHFRYGVINPCSPAAVQRWQLAPALTGRRYPMRSTAVRRLLPCAFVAFALFWQTHSAIAADGSYPNKPVVFMTHSGPGGGMDTMLRRMTDIMAKERLVTQQTRVENVQGGGGAKAMTTLIKRKGDDHVLAGMTSVWVAAPLTNPDIKISYKDMTTVALLGLDPNIVVVRGDAPFKTMKELIDYAKANPNKLKQAGGSVASNPNFDRISIGENTGASWDYVAFPSGGEAVTALLGGHVDLVIGQPADMSGHLRAGTLRALASFSETRLAGHPQVPTLRESGVSAPVSRGTVRGIVAPPEFPQTALQYWEDVLRKLTQTQAYQQFSAEIELFPKFLRGAEFRQFLDEESDTLKKALSRLGEIKK